MKTIHGHDVLDMMINSGETFTKESLVAKIKDEFGADTVFNTCTAFEMTAEELVSFLEKKGKFISKEDGFTTNINKICSH